MKDRYTSLATFSLRNYLLKHNIACQKVVMFGNFGAYNMGDEAILAGQLEDLKGIKNLHVTVIARYPAQVSRLHRVHAVGLLSIQSLIKYLYTADGVVIGGGGIFCKNDRGMKGIIFQLYTLCLFLLLPVVLKKKIFVWGIGIYPDMNRMVAFLSKGLLHHVTLLTVRDYASLKLTRKWKLHSALYKDNSFIMSPLSMEKLRQDPFFTKIPVSSHRNVGIALKKPTNRSEEEKLIQRIGDILRKEYKTTRFWFYHLDTHPLYQSDYDFTTKILQSLDKDIRKAMAYVIMPPNRHPQWLFSSFGFLDGFIALRLHSSIFAYRYRLPTIYLSYSEKCQSFIRSIGEKPFAITSLSHSRFTQLKYAIEERSKKKKRNHFDNVLSRKGSMYAYL